MRPHSLSSCGTQHHTCSACLNQILTKWKVCADHIRPLLAGYSPADFASNSYPIDCFYQLIMAEKWAVRRIQLDGPVLYPVVDDRGCDTGFQNWYPRLWDHEHGTQAVTVNALTQNEGFDFTVRLDGPGIAVDNPAINTDYLDFEMSLTMLVDGSMEVAAANLKFQSASNETTRTPEF